MDILKILSRSTKQTKIKLSEKSGSLKLPSAGASPNPQLYHDVAPPGLKRKRVAEKIDGQDEYQSEDDERIDFFAPQTQKSALVDAPKVVSKPKEDDSKRVSRLLDEVECRKLLGSHRLKVTLLPRSNFQSKRVKKSKKIKGKKVEVVKDDYKQIYPQPLVSLGDLQTIYGISGRLTENLMQQGYKIPTEVQMGSLPLLLRPDIALRSSLGEIPGFEENIGNDLLAVAPTGSGKTLAFLIPVVNKIIQRRRVTEDKGVHFLEAIVIAPTKELASQIVNEGKKLSYGTGVKIIGMRKGLRIVDQQDSKDLASSDEGDEEENEEPRVDATPPVAKADILVTTPGLLLHALSDRSTNNIPLPTVRSLVLDEADVLLDQLFKEQTLGIWNSCTNPELRVTLWSATMGSNIEALASSTIYSRRERLDIDDDSRITRLVVGLKDSAIPNITHSLIYAATEPGKLIAFRQLLHPTAKAADATESLRPPFIVFTQTIPRAIALHSELLYDIPAEAGGSSRIAVLHSDLSDTVRDHVMSRFRAGEIWILITTDILSRGVDFRGVNGVVNYDVPNSGASYIHRVGRTGRAGRDGGVAVTFYTKEDIPFVKNIANIIAASEKQAGKPPSEASMQKWLLDALPKPSKEEKKKLKMFGVEARRGGLVTGKDKRDGKGKRRMQISTKSGYERKLENNRKGAVIGSKRRRQLVEETIGEDHPERSEDEWGGIED